MLGTIKIIITTLIAVVIPMNLASQENVRVAKKRSTFTLSGKLKPKIYYCNNTFFLFHTEAIFFSLHTKL
jgi:hypothetical protein